MVAQSCWTSLCGVRFFVRLLSVIPELLQIWSSFDTKINIRIIAVELYNTSYNALYLCYTSTGV